MLTSIRIANFKSYGGATLPLAALTFLSIRSFPPAYAKAGGRIGAGRPCRRSRMT